MTTKTVQVTTFVKVTVDKSKFTPDFMQAFREVFYDFASIDDHIAHLGQLYARGLAHNRSFIEGYGETSEFGIHFELDFDFETEIEP